MEFKIINKYLQEEGRTFVSIRCANPYTAFERVLIGDRTNESDDALIQAVLGQVTTELNPAEGVKKLQEDLHTQAQDYEAKLAKKDEEIQKVKDVAEWSVLARVFPAPLEGWVVSYHTIACCLHHVTNSFRPLSRVGWFPT